MVSTCGTVGGNRLVPADRLRLAACVALAKPVAGCHERQATRADCHKRQATRADCHKRLAWRSRCGTAIGESPASAARPSCHAAANRAGSIGNTGFTLPLRRLPIALCSVIFALCIRMHSPKVFRSPWQRGIHAADFKTRRIFRRRSGCGRRDAFSFRRVAGGKAAPTGSASCGCGAARNGESG